ncbi:M4 family metallopeptidase [Salinisphaera sp. SPP-AMP-43]|uniref:M4 family metallopeptidase n=1 Tax=Salinisphaera sp. SPP-AMP-43 TaxID=3121288 RepID=UPI003C6E627F
MASSTTRRSGVIPPHILDRLLERGPDTLKQCARRTRETDDALRAAVVPTRRNGVRAPAEAELQRTIYDAGHSRTLPGQPARDEGQAAVGDREVNEAYEDLGQTWRFYNEVFDRNSIDNEGLPLIGSVHYGQDYQNAFWNGREMVFGDGDGQVFHPFTRALDVVAHELTHGVTEVTAGLAYQGQSGALNESVSDVFGVMTAQYAAGETADQADWLIGAALLTDQVNGVALRSMARPGSAYDDPMLGQDPQPATMNGYVETRQDNGGVHINSGIPNHAFYRAATALGGYSWETVGPVWYATLRDTRLSADADFAAFAGVTMANAREQSSGDVLDALRQAWQDVGITPAEG